MTTMRRLGILGLCLVLWGIAQVAQAGHGDSAALTNHNMELIGAMPGNVTAITASGNHLYLASGSMLSVLDWSDPDAPNQRSAVRYRQGILHDALTLDGVVILVSTDGYMTIFDMADPASPVLRSQTWLGISQVDQVVLGGQSLYAQGKTGELAVWDLSNPAYPIQTDSLQPFSGSYHLLPGAFYLAAYQGDQLLILNRANSGHLEVVANQRFSGEIRSAGVYQDRVYIAEKMAESNRLRLYTMQVSETGHIQEVGRTEQQSEEMLFHKNLAFSVYAWGRLQLLDLSNPSTPSVMSTVTGGRHLNATQVVEPYVLVREYYCAAKTGSCYYSTLVYEFTDVGAPRFVRSLVNTSTGATVIDQVIGRRAVYELVDLGYVQASDLSLPESSATYKLLTPPHDIAMTNNALFGCYHSCGIQKEWTLDVSNPTAPGLVSTNYQTPGIFTAVYPCALAVSDSYLLVATDALRIRDVSTPANPKHVGTLPFGQFTWNSMALTVSGTTAYLAACKQGVLMISFADPAAPSPVGSYVPDGCVQDVAVKDDLLYLAVTGEGQGLSIVDISSPMSPTLRGQMPYGNAGDIAVSGSTVYVLNSKLVDPPSNPPEFNIPYLAVVDASDPDHPQEITRFSDLMGGEQLEMMGDHVVIADLAGGIRVLDMIDPGFPRSAGRIDTEYATDVAQAGDLIYAWTTGGVRIVSFTPEVRILPDQIVGAPGSHLAFIGYRFPAQTEASVRVNGQDLATLMTDDQGQVSFALDTSDADIGAYFLQVSTADQMASATFVLDPDQPLWDQSGDPLLSLPAELAYTEQVILPFIYKETK